MRGRHEAWASLPMVQTAPRVAVCGTCRPCNRDEPMSETAERYVLAEMEFSSMPAVIVGKLDGQIAWSEVLAMLREAEEGENVTLFVKDFTPAEIEALPEL